MLTLHKDSLQALKDLFTVVLIEPIMVLPELLFKLSLVLFWNLLHVFLIQQRNPLSDDTDNLPNISYPSVLFHFVEDSHYIVQELRLIADIFDKQILCHVSDVAY